MVVGETEMGAEADVTFQRGFSVGEKDVEEGRFSNFVI